ncbi:hypothetical protein NP493_3916g00008 [Ridgeia piscesae]|uniref:Uncharacterized protein n=1 Tax=Ridgeia piscesae TaxID=27915 RepID=A0AAD9MWG2_RIDPI|nr:hypothetical protein NP493_3916g00008 [Ridgeia piscesae]
MPPLRPFCFCVAPALRATTGNVLLFVWLVRVRIQLTVHEAPYHVGRVHIEADYVEHIGIVGFSDGEPVAFHSADHELGIGYLGLLAVISHRSRRADLTIGRFVGGVDDDHVELATL